MSLPVVRPTGNGRWAVILDWPETSFVTLDESYLQLSRVAANLRGIDFRGMLEAEAEKHGVRINYHKRGPQWGRAALGSRRIFIPEPKRFISFFTGLHELGHIMSGHRGGDGKPEYLWEFEAFNWAVSFCVQRGIAVPKKIVDNERNIIAEKLREEVGRGAESLDRNAVKFVREGTDDDPDVRFVKTSVADSGRVLLVKPRPKTKPTT